MRRALRMLAVLAVVVTVGATGACGDDDAAGGDPEAFCDRLDRLSRNDPFLAFGERATNDEIAMAFRALVERADELLDVAPPEARGAARDYAESARALDELLAAVGYDGTAVDARAYRDHQLTYTESASVLERHLRTECPGT